MNRALFTGLTLAGLACLLPTVADAQYGQYPDAPAQANCTITRQRPVYSTQLRTQQVTTFCDVTETQMTQRQVVENVPVTTCANVTVDEGNYKMVWVPKPVTRQVAQTSLQQQVKTVAVPVQVTRRVPRISTQVVPVQTVQYVNETVPVQMTMASPCSEVPSAGMLSPVPQLGFIPGPYQMSPYSSATSIRPSQSASSASQDSDKWQTVPARKTAEQYESVSSRAVPTPREDSNTPSRRSSMFSRVPSAAAVWQSQNSR